VSFTLRLDYQAIRDYYYVSRTVAPNKIIKELKSVDPRACADLFPNYIPWKVHVLKNKISLFFFFFFTKKQWRI
jgi:hypothetical protein